MYIVCFNCVGFIYLGIRLMEGEIGNAGVEQIMKLVPRKLLHNNSYYYYSCDAANCIYNFDCLHTGCGNTCFILDPDYLFGKCQFR